ncbi:monovalent cation/H+ antiporter complex subunit F [Buchananella hordeovulneris]|uniref:PH regulation protein F n=1 Tax=Buchananella hordeovulneris TaxID=52770 RepID=A0A1Q5PVB7_9ACTO|nr:monovalent cation/H+ antiporter complex subunit F [Buchananella hordeovulneris]OKL51360.1 hypothetical protein BSZ40_07240 [Buchananella hordeovulneris]
MITAIYCAAALVLAVAALLVIVRIERGPSMLDRAIGLDVFAAVVIGALAVTASLTGRTDLVVLLVVLAIISFMSSTYIARFVARERDEDARVLTVEEAQRLDAAREEAEAAALQAERAARADAAAEAPEDTPTVGAAERGWQAGALPEPRESRKVDDLEGVDLDDEDTPLRKEEA